MPPCVSIVVPIFNASQTLPQALESIKQQTFGDWECLLIDDGSTEAIAPVVDAYLADTRFRLTSREHRGIAASRNYGIRAAAGDYVAFLDADDAWRPGKLERQTQMLAAHPEWAGVYTDVQLTDQHLTPRGRSLKEQYHLKCLPTGQIYADLLRRNVITTSSFLVKRAIVLQEAFDEHLPVSEDWDLWLRIAKQHPLGAVEEPLAYYRIHDTGAHLAGELMEQGGRAIVEKNFGAKARLGAVRKRDVLATICLSIATAYFIRAQRKPAGRYLLKTLRLKPESLMAWGLLACLPLPTFMQRALLALREHLKFLP